MKKYVVKIIVGGAGGSGKTTMIHRYVNSVFIQNTQMTIGVKFALKTVYYQDLAVTLQIWDFGGQERFRFMLESYVAGAKNFIFVADATRLRTLDNMEEWIDIMRKHGLNDRGIFALTKIDRGDDVVVDDQYARDLASQFNLELIKCSSKTGEGIDTVFNAAVNQILEYDLDIETRLPADYIPPQPVKPKEESSTPKKQEKAITSPRLPSGPPGPPSPPQVKPKDKLPVNEIRKILWAIFAEIQPAIKKTDRNDLYKSKEIDEINIYQQLVKANILQYDMDEISDNLIRTAKLISESEPLIDLTKKIGIRAFSFLEKILQSGKVNSGISLMIISCFISLSLKLYYLSFNSEIHKIINIKIFSHLIEMLKYETDLFIQDLAGSLYFLLGCAQVQTRSENGGFSFFNAGLKFYSIKNLLSSKCFYLSAALMAVHDHSFFETLVFSNKDLIMHLTKGNRDYSFKQESDELEDISDYEDIGLVDMPSTYIDLAIKYMEAVDFSNREQDVLDPFYEIVEKYNPDGLEDHMILSITKKTLESIEQRMHVVIVDVDILPDIPEVNDAITVKVELMNILPKESRCFCRIIAPGADLSEQIVKIKIEPKKNMTIKFNVGRPHIYGNLIYSIDLLDLDEYILYRREIPFYIVDPSEILRFVKIETDSTEINEDSPITITAHINNSGKQKENCIMELKSQIFNIEPDEYIMSIEPGETIQKIITLGKPNSNGEGLVYLKLINQEEQRICDSKTIEFYVKRSVKKVMFKITKEVIKGASNFL